MAVRQTVQTFGISQRVRIPRTCEHCHAAYEFEREITGESFDAAMLEKSTNKLIARYQESVDTYGCLCPSCGEFASAAVDRHFPRGFHEGLLGMLQNAYRGGLNGDSVAMTCVRAIPCAALSTAFVAIDVLSRNGGFLMFGVLFGLWTAVALFASREKATRWLTCRNMVEMWTEDASRIFVLMRYRECDGLDGDTFLGGGRQDASLNDLFAILHHVRGTIPDTVPAPLTTRIEEFTRLNFPDAVPTPSEPAPTDELLQLVACPNAACGNLMRPKRKRPPGKPVRCKKCGTRFQV